MSAPAPYVSQRMGRGGWILDILRFLQRPERATNLQLLLADMERRNAGLLSELDRAQASTGRMLAETQRAQDSADRSITEATYIGPERRSYRALRHGTEHSDTGEQSSEEHQAENDA